MINDEKQNNRVFVRGEIVSEAKYSHEVYGEGFYETEVSVKRLSGQAYIFPVTVTERLIASYSLKVGTHMNAIGQLRTVFIKEIIDAPQVKNPNNVVLSGYICKPPVYRTTPFSREIADVLIAVNRAYNKSDYIPCIAWGRNARFVRNLAVGEKIAIAGRIQSREYVKKISEDESRTMTAYEVSICKLAAYDNVECFDMDEEFGVYPAETKREEQNIG